MIGEKRMPDARPGFADVARRLALAAVCAVLLTACDRLRLVIG